MLSTSTSSPFSNSRRPTLTNPPPHPYYNPAIWHPAAIVPARRAIVPHHSAAKNQCEQEQGWIQEFQAARTNQGPSSTSKRPPSFAHYYPPPPRINPHHTYHPASMSQRPNTASDGDAGNFGNVTGAEEVAVGGTAAGQDRRGNGGKERGKEEDKALEKGGFGAIAGAEEVKAKL